MSDEHHDGRRAVSDMTGRLVEHEQALRRQAQEEGADRRPRSAEDLRKIAVNAARRYDHRHDG